jgi:hypothetical protein
MKSLKPLFSSVAILTAALLSGCGSSGVTGKPDTTSQGQDNGQIVAPIDDGGGYGAYPLGFSVSGVTAAEQLQGIPSTSSYSGALRTDSLFKVKVTVKPASRNVNTPVPTNYAANYTCAVIRITPQMEQNGVYSNLIQGGAGTQSYFDTDPISVTGTPGCAGSVPSQTIDLSPYLFPGHGNLRIVTQVVSANTYCTEYNNHIGFWWNYATLCANFPMNPIYEYHVVNGNLEVQVNGTDFN